MAREHRWTARRDVLDPAFFHATHGDRGTSGGMRWLAWLSIAAAAGACDSEEIAFIPGTGALPECSEGASANLDGTCWFDSGTVAVTSTGCPEAMPGETFRSCGLAWSFTQSGNDVTIIVDGEYRIEGRFCGDQLHLRGGWWLPVEDEGQCTYADDSAEEVGIQAGGNTLTYAAATDSNPEVLAGVLAVQGACAATYDATLQPGGGCFFE